MNIAFLIHNQVGTGPYFKVLEQCAALVSAGNRVTLFCTSKSRRFGWTIDEQNGVEIFSAPDILFGQLRQGVDLWNALNRCLFAIGRKFDIVHAIDCRPNVVFPALFIRRLQKIPLVLSWWDLFGGGGLASERSGSFYARTFGKIETWFEENFRKYANSATTITEFLRLRLELMGFHAEQIIIQRVGCELNEKLPSQAVVRRKFGFDDTPTFCFIGTMYPADFDLVRNALKIVKQKRNFRVIWIGNFAISPEICQELNIFHTGRLKTTEEVYEYLSASDICLLPMKVNITNAARWHSKISDYFNAERPVITTPVSDFPKIFRENNVGWLAPSDKPEEFAETLLTALSTPETWHEKGQSAKEFVRRELDVQLIARQLADFYEKTKRKEW